MGAQFQVQTDGWSSVWEELFENAEPHFLARRIYCMTLDQTWNALPNVTMIGDAAHVMPPFAGEGANMTMLDALELSECLTSGEYGNLQEAVSVYETNIRRRAARAARESLENGERMHSADALEKMVAAMAGAENVSGHTSNKTEIEPNNI